MPSENRSSRQGRSSIGVVVATTTVGSPVETRRLEERRVVRVDLDASVGDQPLDRAVGENHPVILSVAAGSDVAPVGDGVVHGLRAGAVGEGRRAVADLAARAVLLE